MTTLELQMIEGLKNRGASNNGSHPKQAPDPSHSDVPPINRIESNTIDTNDQCQNKQLSAHQSATITTLAVAAAPLMIAVKLKDGLHLMESYTGLVGVIM